MAQPSIQALLRNGWTPEKLLVKCGIDFHRGNTHPDLYSFTYDRTAPLESVAVKECCGLILDASQNWQVVARPFDAFFGYGTQHAVALDWVSVRAEDWLDGTLCILYFHDGDWHVATKNSPDASVPVGGLSDRPVRELFWETWKREKFNLPKESLAHLTWLFELTGPENGNVVQYFEPHLTCLGMRHKMGLEIRAEYQDLFPFQDQKRLQSIKDILTSLSVQRGVRCKGYIAVDRYFHRAKFYHPHYRALRAGRVQMRLEKWLEFVRMQEADDRLEPFFPEYKGLIVTLTEAVTRLETEIDAAYWLVKDLQEQKDFAMAVKDLPYAGVLFALRKGHIQNAKQGLRAMPIERLLRLAQLKKESFYAIRGMDDRAAVIGDGDPSVNDSLGG